MGRIEQKIHLYGVGQDLRWSEIHTIAAIHGEKNLNITALAKSRAHLKAPFLKWSASW